MVTFTHFDLADRRVIEDHALHSVDEFLLVHAAGLLKTPRNELRRDVSIQGRHLGISAVELLELGRKGLVRRSVRVVEKVVCRSVHPFRRVHAEGLPDS